MKSINTNIDDTFLEKFKEEYNSLVSSNKELQSKLDSERLRENKLKVLIENYEFLYSKTSNEESDVIPEKNDNIKSSSKENEHIKKDKKTFEEVILEILSDGNPRTSKKLYEDYKKHGLKEMDSKDFSSRLSMRAKIENNKIANIQFKEFPIEERFWWGLSSWIENDSYITEYKNKITEYMKNK